jgi:hypothetical protein
VCSSPRLIAAYRDLHRLSMPRHPPCALLRLISYLIVDCVHAMDTSNGKDSSHWRISQHGRYAHTIRPSIVKEQPGPEGPGDKLRSECESEIER